MSGEVLAWLSVWSEVQMICICSSWCHCHPIISCCSKVQNGLPFWCLLTQVVLEKRPLNGYSVVVSTAWDIPCHWDFVLAPSYTSDWRSVMILYCCKILLCLYLNAWLLYVNVRPVVDGDYMKPKKYCFADIMYLYFCCYYIWVIPVLT